METTIRIHSDLLSNDIIEGIKKMFPHREIEIKIRAEMDATAYVLNNPSFANELNERIAEYEKSKEVITVQPEDLP